jgi:hypothetical protein
MLTHFRLVAFATLLTLCAAPLLAGNTWNALEDAQKVSAKSGKPVFLLTILAGPYAPDATYTKLREKAQKDENAGLFVLGTINIYQLDMKSAKGGGSPYGQNDKLAKKWGGSTTVSVLAPGAKRPLWQLEGGGGKDDIFKQAAEAYKDWNKEVTELEAKLKKNRDLKKDPDRLLKLSRAWADGYVADKAVDYLDDAFKLVKKADKKDPRLEELDLRRADILLDCESWKDAASEYAAFLKHHKESKSLGKAHIGRARALAGSGDTDAAVKELEALAKDDAAADMKAEAEALLKELKKEQG